MNSNQKFILKYLKPMYCGFSARIVCTNKVVYVSQYGPTGGTIIPIIGIESSEEELKPDDHVRIATFSRFIDSKDVYQTNGRWKGKQYGRNNFTLTSQNWLSGLWVNDQIEITVIKEGIVKYDGKPFTDTSIILNSTLGVSCNSLWNNQIYPVYLTDNPPPQRASDTIVIWYNELHKKMLIKMLRRGSGYNVDSPGTIVVSGGEHKQLENGEDARNQALITINEEIGLPLETINKCFFLPLGIYNSEYREGRYSKFSMIQDGNIVECGIDRNSESDAHILLLITEDDVIPKECDHTDKHEITSKWWEDIYCVLNKYPTTEFMLEDHRKFIPDSIKKVHEFLILSQEERNIYKF